MTILNDIEDAIIARLTAAGLNVIHWDDSPKLDSDQMTVVIARLLVRSGEFARLTMTRSKCTAELVIVVDFLKPAGGADQSRGTYELLLGIAQSLWNKTLDLNISPIKPVKFARDFDIQKLNGSISTYVLVFETGFTIEESTDEADVDFLTLGIKYYLQDPVDDGVEDAEDEINF